MNIGTNVGRWRPVQGLFQAYAVYSGIRGVIAGPVQGQAVSNVLGSEPSFWTYLFYISMIIGGLTAMLGEIWQLSATRDAMIIRADKMLDGLYIESAGDFLIALNYMSLVIAVIYSPTTVWERSIVYLAVALGFLGRFCQSISDIGRIKQAMRGAGIDV